MEVGVQERKERELGDHRLVRTSRDCPAGVPVPFVQSDGQRPSAKEYLCRANSRAHQGGETGNGALKAFHHPLTRLGQQQLGLAQVPQHGHKQRPHQAK